MYDAQQNLITYYKVAFPQGVRGTRIAIEFFARRKAFGYPAWCLGIPLAKQGARRSKMIPRTRMVSSTPPLPRNRADLGHQRPIKNITVYKPTIRHHNGQNLGATTVHHLHRLLQLYRLHQLQEYIRHASRHASIAIIRLRGGGKSTPGMCFFDLRTVYHRLL